MTRWMMAVIVVVGLAVGVVWSGAGMPEAKAAETAAMYVEETVVGTILASQKMYAAEEVEWYRGELRVDRAEAEDSALEAGQVLKVPSLADARAAVKPAGGRTGERGARDKPAPMRYDSRPIFD